MRLTKEQKKAYRDVVLLSVPFDNEGRPLSSAEARAKHIYNRFKSEYGWMIERVGVRPAMCEWLAGLALDIPFRNFDILALAERVNGERYEGSVAERIVENYFNFMAGIVLGIFKEFNLEV